MECSLLLLWKKRNNKNNKQKITKIPKSHKMGFIRILNIVHNGDLNAVKGSAINNIFLIKTIIQLCALSHEFTFK